MTKKRKQTIGNYRINTNKYIITSIENLMRNLFKKNQEHLIEPAVGIYKLILKHNFHEKDRKKFNITDTTFYSIMLCLKKNGLTYKKQHYYYPSEVIIKALESPAQFIRGLIQEYKPKQVRAKRKFDDESNPEEITEEELVS